VLLVDEATSQLDRDTAGRVRRLVLGLADRTVLWVSHREDEEWPGPVLHVSEDGAVSWARAPR
jgi:ABC-type transport system involved in cytochrome bd biosynthesis fused ATPase/permease subunit